MFSAVASAFQKHHNDSWSASPSETFELESESQTSDERWHLGRFQNSASIGLEESFRRLARRWAAESSLLSSPLAMAALPSYRAIISMGKEAIPLILSEMQRQRNHWFTALFLLTGEDPVNEADQGNVNKMTKAWLEWGKQHGHLST